jgi:hypothetical protein
MTTCNAKYCRLSGLLSFAEMPMCFHICYMQLASARGWCQVGGPGAALGAASAGARGIDRPAGHSMQERTSADGAPCVQRARRARHDDINTRMRLVDGADGRQVGIHKLTQHSPCGGVQYVHWMQGNAPKVLRNVPEHPQISSALTAVRGCKRT